MRAVLQQNVVGYNITIILSILAYTINATLLILYFSPTQGGLEISRECNYCFTCVCFVLFI